MSNIQTSIRANRYTVTKGYFSGQYILRIWDKDGETIHNSAHSLPEHAGATLYHLKRGEFPPHTDRSTWMHIDTRPCMFPECYGNGPDACVQKCDN